MYVNHPAQSLAHIIPLTKGESFIAVVVVVNAKEIGLKTGNRFVLLSSGMDSLLRRFFAFLS